MIAIIDGGSTKCDWVLITPKGEEMARWETTGLNPNHISKAQMIEVLQNQDYTFSASEVKSIYFYGSGCGIEKNQKVVAEALERVFTMADITVKGDMLGAAYAVYNGSPSMVCILGTGSNSCFFDGKDIRRDLPSLGFLIGDEGSGCALGKLLVKNFFMKKMPSDLHQEFEKEFNLNIDDLIRNMYHNSHTNAYLASFSKFIVSRKQHPYLQNLVFQELKNYLEYQVLPYPEAKEVEINFIGSIAYYYEDILREVMAGLNLKIGKVMKKPIDALVDYHKAHLH